VGIRDVAARAGVSIATVSNVINKPGRASQETSARVRAVMAELGYVPNQLARQLRTGVQTSIGMVVLTVANPFFADLAHACEAAAEAAGYDMTIGSSNESTERETRYLELFGRQQVAGVLVAPVLGQTSAMEMLHQRGVPVVLFDDARSDGALPTVFLDGRAGGYLAARHLIEIGCRRLVFVGGPPGLVEERRIGAMRAAAEHENAVLSHIETLDTTIAAGSAAGRVIDDLDPSERPDGIFAANDLLALGIQQSLLSSRRIDLPRDVAIVGFDDIPFAATAAVPLTSIRQPVEQLAAEAVHLLVAPSAAPMERVRLEPELVARASTLRFSPA